MISRIDTLLSTTDQLQAEIGGINKELLLVYLCILSLCLLYAALAWKVSRMN